MTSEAPISIEPRHAHEAAGLQATDYLLWALQRCYEKQEDRYLDYVWPCVRLVHDLDDIKERPYGQFYGQDRRLTAELVQSRRRRI